MYRLIFTVLFTAQLALADGWTYCLTGAWNLAMFKESPDQNVELVGFRAGRTMGHWEFYVDALNVGLGMTSVLQQDSIISYDGSLLFVDEYKDQQWSLSWVPEAGISYSLLSQESPNLRSNEKVDALSLQAGYSLQSYLASHKYYSYPYVGVRMLLYSWGVDWSSWRNPRIFENHFYMGLRIDPVKWDRFSIFWNIPLHFPSTTYAKI